MNGTTHFLALDAGALLRLQHAAGTGVAVSRGCAWITQENDNRDIVLPAGRQFLLDRPGLAILQMLERGEIRVDFVGPRSSLARTGSRR